tara:strand:- start:3362 stop:3904 length:543 start_codon:yes stop_codon:yes gene_type:complete
MKINIGSMNRVKIDAVKEMIDDYTIFSRGHGWFEFCGIDVDSGVYKQPRSLEETLEGARNRATAAFEESDCDYSFGIESGLMEVVNTKTGYMNTCACVVFDGKDYHTGLSSCFEYPQEVMDLVLREGLEINEAVHKLGLTNNPKIGSGEGFVSALTNGRLNRKNYVKQAIMMALIDLDNA